MKIAIIHPSLKVKGGAENAVVWLAEELTRRGNEVAVFVSEYDDEFYGSRKNKNYKIVDIGGQGYQSGIIDNLKIGFKLRDRLREYDLVNPHNYPAHIWVYFAKLFSKPSTFLLRRGASRHKVRGKSKFPDTIWSCNEPKRDLYFEICSPHCKDMLHAVLPNSIKIKISRIIDKLSARSLTAIFSISETITVQARKIYDVQNIQTCLLGIPFEKFFLKSPKLLEKSYILTVSKLEKRKNIDSIIYAINILVKEDRFLGFKYYIAGTGSEYDHINRLIKHLNLQDYVVLKGFVSNEELFSLYAGCVLLIYLCIDEPLGLPFLEAAVYKKAVIAPSHGGPSEVLMNEKTGLFVNPFDPFDIAEKIFTLTSDKGKAVQMGIAGYNRLIEGFTLERYVDRFETKIKKGHF